MVAWPGGGPTRQSAARAAEPASQQDEGDWPVDRREAQPREQDGLAFTVGIAGHGICLCDFGIDHAGSVASAVGKIASIWAPT